MEDFDIGQLASYLHLTPAQVLKMAERNRLPGRKVGGQWRFPEAEIHHWLEERIGAADEEQLGQVEAMLDRTAGAEKTPHLGKLLHPEAVAVPLLARTRSSVVREMCKLAANTGLLWDPAAMAEAVQAREAMHPTVLDSGVALLHPRRPQTSILADSLLAIGITRSPIPFSDAGQLTDVFFLICSYDDAVHLRLLAKLSRILNLDGVLTGLRAAESPRDAIAILRQADDELYDPSELENHG